MNLWWTLGPLVSLAMIVVLLVVNHRLQRMRTPSPRPSPPIVPPVVEPSHAGPLIVFVTTCRGRTEHLKQTLPRNLADNPSALSKFVVLDYSSQDDLLAYLKSAHARELASGKLVVYSYPGADRFHMSHAKNMAARCGILEGADILVTLDADNFTGLDFDQFVYDQFSCGSTIGPERDIFLCPNFPLIKSLPHGPLRPARGYAGRLAIRTQDFIKAGGYDEAFDTWRGEDMDLIFRLQRMGYEMRLIDNRYLETIAHGAEVRFKEYPHARQYENKGEMDNLIARTETVVNGGKIGCGYVHRVMGNLTPGELWNGRNSIELEHLPTRVFGIGLHKTGTTSLHEAFQILGFDSLHWGTGEAPLIWNEMKSTGRSRTLERFYALSDLPIPLLYRKLDAAYLGSKFILTLRNERDWIESVRRLWDPSFNPTRWIWDVYPFTNRIHTVLYGTKDFDAKVMLTRYRAHTRDVLAYFKNRPQDLLVLDEPFDWPDLCRFLGRPIPSVPYPHAYASRRRNWQKTAEWSSGSPD